ncbi:MAG: hypothetical protein U9O54_03200, partial [Chloroflexota bacterium]|nr:hypothetical protein [Chloroflexota bacterium]
MSFLKDNLKMNPLQKNHFLPLRHQVHKEFRQKHKEILCGHAVGAQSEKLRALCASLYGVQPTARASAC